MFRKRLSVVIACAGLFVIWLLSSGRATLAGGGLQLAWWSVDGGGGASAGQRFAVRGVIGQPDTSSMDGERYSINGGYWDAPGPARQAYVYLPVAFKAQQQDAAP